MDEVYFLLSQRLENFQIWLAECVAKAGECLEAGLSGEAAERAREAAERLWRLLVESAASLGRSGLTGRLSAALRAELTVSGASLAAGCVGFAVGGGVGLALGSRLRSPARPVALMRAVAAASFDGPDSVVVLEDAVVPSVLGESDVSVRVMASCLDLVDLRVASGYARRLRRFHDGCDPNSSGGELPVILGRDGAGLVVDVGRSVTQVEVGDAVFFLSPEDRRGTLSDYATLPEDCVRRKPARLSFEAAAALPYSGVAAWEAVARRAGLSTRNAHTKRVLVHSGSSGCGWAVVQLCSALGATTVVTSLHRASTAMKALGATLVVPLEAADAENALLRRDKFDVVFNTVGSQAEVFCRSVCRSDGLVVAASPPDLPSDTFGVFLGSVHSLYLRLSRALRGEREAKGRAEALEELTKLVEGGRLRPLVDAVFTPEELEAALSHLQSAASLGRTVVRFGTRSPPPGNRPDLLGSPPS